MCVWHSAKAQIVSGLDDQVVPYKTNVSLSCEVVGVPLPFRSWLKDGRTVCCRDGHGLGPSMGWVAFSSTCDGFGGLG